MKNVLKKCNDNLLKYTQKHTKSQPVYTPNGIENRNFNDALSHVAGVRTGTVLKKKSNCSLISNFFRVSISRTLLAFFFFYG